MEFLITLKTDGTKTFHPRGQGQGSAQKIIDHWIWIKKIISSKSKWSWSRPTRFGSPLVWYDPQKKDLDHHSMIMIQNKKIWITIVWYDPEQKSLDHYSMILIQNEKIWITIVWSWSRTKKLDHLQSDMIQSKKIWITTSMIWSRVKEIRSALPRSWSSQRRSKSHDLKFFSEIYAGNLGCEFRGGR